MADGRRVILASGSQARKAMLQAAGVEFTARAAAIDEERLTREWLAAPSSASASEVASRLAQAKAVAVSQTDRTAVVIGADQVLALGNKLFSKATSVAAAKDVLLELRGKTHALHSAVSVAVDGKVLWSHVETARLSVRNFSEAWLARYVDEAGDSLTHSVGAYALEGRGVQLFERVEGDYFTVLGLPLVPLLAELRRLGLLET